MRKLIFLNLLILIMLLPLNAAAQDSITLSTMKVDLWPEYDRPEMLVIYRIELSPDVSLPVDLSFQIPAAAGEPNAVAVKDPSGSLLNAPYERQVEGDWAVITLTASLPGIQIEYYDPQLLKHGSERIFQYNWQGYYPVDSMVVQLQQPINARQLAILPSATRTSTESDGLTYHTIDLGPQLAGSIQNISISYIKDTDTLSIESFQAQASAPISGSTPGRVNVMNFLPWSLGILGAALIIGGAWWYWKTGNLNTQARRRSAHRGSRGKRPDLKTRQPRGTSDDGVYCHECGKRAEVSDRFCRSCGTKLRAV